MNTKLIAEITNPSPHGSVCNEINSNPTNQVLKNLVPFGGSRVRLGWLATFSIATLLVFSSLTQGAHAQQTLPEISISSNMTSVAEDTAVTFQLASDISTSVTVNVEVTQEGDFFATSAVGTKMVTFSNAQTANLTIPAPATADTTYEADGRLTATIQDSSTYTIDSDNGDVSVNITDNEATPAGISIIKLQSSIYEGEDARFRVAADSISVDSLYVRVNITQTGSFFRFSNVKQQTVRFRTGQLTHDISIGTYDDETVESDGSITATIMAPSGSEYTRATNYSNASITIKDNEPELSISTTQTTVEEGNPIQFTITASIVPTIPIAIRLGVNPTGKFLVSDALDRLVLMDAGSKTQNFEIVTLNDQGDEDNGSATITITTGIGYSVASAPNNSVQVTITDNDPLPSISISSSKPTYFEHEDQIVIFTSSRPVAQNLRVNFVLHDITRPSAPGFPAPETVTILRGESTATYTNTGEIDSADSSNTYYNYTLSPSTKQVQDYEIENSPHDFVEFAVLNDDPDPTNLQITISTNQNSVIEGEVVNFSILSNRVIDFRRRILYRIESTGNFIMEAQASPVSIGPTHELIVFPGERNWDLTIPTINDDIEEEDGILKVTVIDANDYHTTTDDSITVIILDNDSNQINLPTISISATNLMVTEGDDITFTISSDIPLDSEINVDLYFEEGPEGNSILQKSEFITGQKNISAILDQNNQSRVITALTDDDKTFELDGYIVVSISSDRSPQSEYQVSQTPNNSVRFEVRDNDKPNLSVIPMTTSITEGERAAFRILSDKPISLNSLEVLFRLQNSIGNYIDESVRINYSTGSPFDQSIMSFGLTSIDITVGSINDSIDNANGSIELILEPSSINFYTISSEFRKATVEVFDNDETPVISISNTSNSVFFDDGDSSTVMISSSLQLTTDLNIKLSESRSGDPATEITKTIRSNTSAVNVDSYSFSNSLTRVDLTIKPDTNSPKRYFVASEPQNSINLVLKSAAIPGVSIKPVKSVVNEGDLTQFTIESTDPITTNPLSVEIELRDENNAIIQVNNQNSTTWQIPTNLKSTTQSVPNILNTGETLNGSITAKILASSNNKYVVSESNRSATIDIIDVNGNTELSISSLNDTVNEGELVKFRISRVMGPVPTESLNIEVRLEYLGDYFDSNLSTQQFVNWPSNNTSNYVEFEIETFNDDIGENSGQISATLIKNLNYTVGVSRKSVVKIFDNDLPTITAHTDTPTIGLERHLDGFSFSFIVRSSKAVSSNLSVNIGISETRNFILGSTPSTTTISPSKTETRVTINTRTVTETTVAESYVSLKIIRGLNYVVGWQSQASIIVSNRNNTGNSQGTGPLISISANTNQINEGESVFISLSADRVHSSQQSIAIIFSPLVNENIFDTRTFIEFVTIARNTQNSSFRYLSVDDDIDEPDRELTVSVVNLGTYKVGENSSLNLTVLDNDEPEISIFSFDDSIVEDNEVTFTLESTTVLDTGLVVNVDISELGNTNNFYSGESTRRIPIEAGTERSQFTVSLDGDTQDEQDTLLTVEIESGQNYRIGAESRVILEVKDDDLNEISLSADSEFVLEGDMITLNLNSTTIPDTELMVNVNISETGTNYYTGAATQQVPISITNNSAQFMVNTDENNVTGDDGEITISLAPESTNYQLGTSSSVTITVVDDDTNRISIDATSDSVVEGGMIEYTLSATSASSSELDVNVEIVEVDGGGDFYSGNTTRIIDLPASDTMVNFMVNTDSDNLDEDDEAITVFVRDGTGYKPNPIGKSVLVTDDDDTPIMSLSNATFEVDEDVTGGNFLVNVSLSIPAITQVDYTYTLSGGATSGTDIKFTY